MQTRVFRKIAPAGLVFFAAASTGTLLASDNCGVSLVQRLTDATRKIQEHTGPHKHTQETLAKWQVWGEDYLAKHGHPYEPPQRKRVSEPPDQQNANFQFLCDLPPVPEDTVYETALLEPGPLAPLLEDMPEVPVDRIPPAVLPPTGSTPVAGPPEYALPPLYAVPIGGVPVPPAKTPTTPNSPDQPTTPTTPVIPTGVTPEPGSLALLGTGLAVVMGLRRRSDRSNASEVS